MPVCVAAPVAYDPAPLTLAFRRGQLDALVRTHLDPAGLFTPEMQQTLALRQLSQAWAAYREDRSITLGARLVGAECAAERDAFLALLTAILPSPASPLAEAVRTVRRIAVAPLAAEARQAATIAAQSMVQLEAVIATLAGERLPTDPPERLLALIDQHRYSLGPAGDDALGATALSPCWAINLLALARPQAFALTAPPLPLPALARRRLFRADLSPAKRRDGARECLLRAMLEAARDLDRIWRATRRFAAEFPQQRSHSRLGSAWLLLVGLEDLTPAQLGRALGVTKAGAGKLLRQLESGGLARSNGMFEPFSCTPIAAAPFAADLY
jgi:hypothetical protein